MTALAQAIQSLNSGGGRKVDIPFRGLADLVNLKTGQLVVIGGAPGSGKSHFAANWAWRAQMPVIYWAMDDSTTTLETLTALASGRRTSEVSFEGDAQPYWVDYLRKKGKREDLIPLTRARTVQDLKARLEAYEEWLMETPPLVLVDNTYNLKVEGSNYMENGFYAEVLPEVLELAKEKGTCIALLHHIKRAGDAIGTHPLRMNDLLFAGEREAAHVWGIYHREDKRQMTVQVLKQRNGKADPNGGLSVRLDWTPEEGRLHST
jgi:predicted ATP-dependent serine protease